MAGVPVPMVETGIAASALVIGAAVLLALRPPMAVAAVIAWFHGERGHQKAPAAEYLILAVLVWVTVRKDLTESRESQQRELTGQAKRLEELRAELAPLAGRGFLVFHPAWGYLCADYGLRQVSIQREGKEPADRQLTELISAAPPRGMSTSTSPRARMRCLTES